MYIRDVAVALGITRQRVLDLLTMLWDLTGTVGPGGTWEWDGVGDPRDERGNTIYRVQARREEATRTRRALLAAALSGYDLHDRSPGPGYYLADLAPDSTEYAGVTDPGSPWDEACDEILADIRALLPACWVAEWSDDDIVIEYEAAS